MKYVFFLEDLDYNKYICNAVRGKKDTYIFPGVGSKLATKLFKIHNAWPLNKRFELPWKSFWFKRCLDEKNFSREDNIIFLFYECFHFSYSKKYLNYLKKKYINSKFVFLLMNPVGDYILSKLEKVKDCYDEIITFFQSDADAYGYLCYESGLYGAEQLPESDLPETDVFFVGEDKGRLNVLLNIYETLTKNGLKCDFYITNVPIEKQKYSSDIVYNTPIPYEEVLQHIQKTKCILEVLQKNGFYCSLRTLEAYAYKKKLLTTNQRIYDADFYTPEIVGVIEDSKNFDCSFIKNKVEEVLYEEKDFYKFEGFRNFLEKIFNTKEKKV